MRSGRGSRTWRQLRGHHERGLCSGQPLPPPPPPAPPPGLAPLCAAGGRACPELGRSGHGRPRGTQLSEHACAAKSGLEPAGNVEADKEGDSSRLCHGLPVSLMRRSSRARTPDELGSRPQLTSLGPRKQTHRSDLVPLHLGPTPTRTTRGHTQSQHSRRVSNAARHPRHPRHLAGGRPRVAPQHWPGGSFPCSR